MGQRKEEPEKTGTGRTKESGENEQRELYTPAKLAKLFGYSKVQSIDQLVDKGILHPVMVEYRGREVRRYDLEQSVLDYVTYLRNRLPRRGTDMDVLAAMGDADTRYKEAKAAKMELELAELQGRMHRSEDVETVVGGMVSKLRAEILALPGGLAKDVADARDAADASAIIKAAVNDLLNRMSQYRYDEREYDRIVRRREKWMNEQAEDE